MAAVFVVPGMDYSLRVPKIWSIKPSILKNIY
jgi:hypothetical protein